MMSSIRWMPIAFEQMAKIIQDHSSEKEVFAIILQALAISVLPSDSPNLSSPDMAWAEVLKDKRNLRFPLEYVPPCRETEVQLFT